MRVGTCVQVNAPEFYAFHGLQGIVVESRPNRVNVVEIPIGFDVRRLPWTDDELIERS